MKLPSFNRFGAPRMTNEESDLLINEGNALEDAGAPSQALEIYLRVASANSAYGRAHINAGNALGALGRTDEALAAYQRAAELQPEHAGVRLNMGNLLFRAGALEEAADRYREALQLRQGWADAWFGLAHAQEAMGALDEAMLSCREALSADGKHIGATSKLAGILKRVGQTDAALELLRGALATAPEDPTLLRRFAEIESAVGNYDEAIQAYRRLLKLRPSDFGARSNLLWALNLNPDASVGEILSEHVKFGEMAAAQSAKTKHGRLGVDSKKPLRVGYVSPDFRRHSVSCFIECVLENHDPREVECHCFYDSPDSDNVTERLRALAHTWHEISGLTDDDVRDLIVANGIDILVDLTGHTANNRLTLFALKPAPVQFTWLGYLCTTGVREIDYRISDAKTDPPGMSESWQVEEFARLPDSQWCYRPHLGPSSPTASPMLQNGYCTFGSFNQEQKLNNPLIDSWASLLAAIPGSRIRIVGVGSDTVERRLRRRFLDHSIASERFDLLGRLPLESYSRAFRDVDIALDSFPYTGATTTCDSLYHGVPVSTIAGNRAVARSGVSILTAMGMQDWVSSSCEEQIALLRTKISDPAAISKLRSALPRIMGSSPLMDGVRFTRNMESIFSIAWRRYCHCEPRHPIDSGESVLKD